MLELQLSILDHDLVQVQLFWDLGALTPDLSFCSLEVVPYDEAAHQLTEDAEQVGCVSY